MRKPKEKVLKKTRRAELGTLINPSGSSTPHIVRTELLKSLHSDLNGRQELIEDVGKRSAGRGEPRGANELFWNIVAKRLRYRSFGP